MSHDTSIKLSEREKQCLQFAAEGRSSWAIGRELKISENTVNYHKNALRKLATRTRVQGIIKAIRLKLIPDPSQETRRG
ncbi:MULTISPECIES: response regulator transcription factor [Bradyrhizobium]|uniref:LuxR family transcriptional regulator n=3 Tax=Bradyrhizobium TaxID=374 RepID=A0AAE6CCD1_9BRAD|nr:MULTISPECIES: helix-turn-helix transcriptional regulator [Bradyrhizobium]MCG2629312.1 helix-turn-helix transcriptional regulator [Bradyrhizobium zhengyangense]MCG2644593.1 helix-turn-helix transcriptional regulator [Bradyrhizobium zhengyangense]MCG2670826.1 helix-turn-helix transcriptional regulator [Bradyrhizobium zhengyangense]MDN4984458.1 helix-turn-helix transcriptional regulator [Bradyrhizobium sp. WYCCWR 13022]MDN5002450.1 helix-turn-helix transcriptional regulator [Bradyrhizobium sp.